MSIKTLGREIKKIRKEKGLSQRELSRLAGINHTYLSKIESGMVHYFPSETVIKDLARALGTKREKLAQYSDRIPKEAYRDYIDVVRKYPEVIDLIKRMLEDSRFAEEILAQVDMKYML